MPNPAFRQNPAPGIDAAAVLAWYDAHARTLPWRVGPADRQRGVRPDPYRVWLSEIMLQQTTVAAVGRYYARFLDLWPTVEALAAAPLDAVLRQWAGLGYYARARNLHACARVVVEARGGRFPERAAELVTLPGIGAYTAAAIAAIAFDERVPVLDGNVERVMARFLALDVPVKQAGAVLRAAVKAAVPARAGDFAQALMDLGATVCAPREAACMLCPLRPDCRGALRDPLAYPVRGEAAARPTRYGHAFVIQDAGGDVFLRSRPRQGLLAGMTETPVSPWTDDRKPAAFPVAAEWVRLGQVIHTFTHFRLELEVWSARISDPAAVGDTGWWAAPADLGAEALPTVFRKVLALALERDRRLHA